MTRDSAQYGVHGTASRRFVSIRPPSTTHRPNVRSSIRRGASRTCCSTVASSSAFGEVLTLRFIGDAGIADIRRRIDRLFARNRSRD
jgi:hypothetical protein